MTTDEIGERRSELIEDLGLAARRSNTLGKRNHMTVLTLGIIAVLASVAAGILGLLKLDSRIVGVLALIPASVTLALNSLKFQAKANWHYDQEIELNALRRRLKYEMPISPSADQIAVISAAWSEMSARMEQQWNRDLLPELGILGNTRQPSVANRN